MRKIQIIIAAIIIFTSLSNGQGFQTENIDRGLVAVALEGSGVYIGWRLLANDPEGISFNVYRGETKINEQPLATSTNFVDSAGTVGDSYTIVPVIDDVEQDASAEEIPWNQNYKTIPLQRPDDGTTPDFNCTDGTGTKNYPDGQDYSYSPNDASAADLDGDGEYEIVLKWDPSNSHDNAHCGYTGNTYLDGLEMDGTLRWRIDLGVNVRSGAHYSPFMVYDLDGDGVAEVICRTASGSKDGSGAYINDGPAADANHITDYRNDSGYVLSGPEFLTVYSGFDGSELATTYLQPARGNVSDWGDSYGNRVDRFTAAIAYLGGDNPSIVWARGIYEKVELAAWDFIEDSLEIRWHFKSQNGYPNWSGMGSHNLSVADVDGDNKDEIIYGNCAIDDDGTGLWTLRTEIASTWPFTGDAMHLADIIPERPGLEKWGCAEGADNPASHLVDAATGEVLWITGNGDGSRATAADLVPGFLGMECWGGTDGLRSANNVRVGPTPTSTNHVVWWDGDLGRELLNATNIQKYGGDVLLLADSCSSNNGSKSNPCLQADLFGDWREEVIWRTSDNNNLRIYTTTDLTEYRIKTLMHDPVYRLAVAWQNNSYNQPPHTSFFLGYEMFTPDSLWPPSKPLNIRAQVWDDTVQIEWDENLDWDLAGYRLYRGKRADSLSLLSDVGTAISYLDTNVTNDSTYYYAVVAYDIDNNQSVFSDVIQARPSSRPDTPTGLSYRYDTNSILLIWDSQDFEQILNVNIYRSESEETELTLYTTIDKSLNSFIDDKLTTDKAYFYTLSVTDTNQVESFRSDVLSITPGSSFTFQSEDASFIGTVYVDNNHLGFHGTAFTNFESNSSGVEFTYMPGYAGGERTLIFRYALGSDDRTGSLTVNGVTRSLTMRGTNEWTNYVLDSVAVELNDGYDNTIRFATTGNDFGNLDEITIVPRAITSLEIGDDGNSIPSKFQLYQNYPNPFNPDTKIKFDLPKAVHVSIDVYDITGRLITKLVNENYQAGVHTVKFDASNLGSGIYLYKIRAANFSQTRKMILLR